MSNKSMQLFISRRDVLKGAAAGAGLGTLGAFPAFGQTDKKIVLSTWGGDYANLLTKHVSVPVLGPRGWTVVNDGSPRADLSSLLSLSKSAGALVAT